MSRVAIAGAVALLMSLQHQTAGKPQTDADQEIELVRLSNHFKVLPLLAKTVKKIGRVATVRRYAKRVAL